MFNGHSGSKNFAVVRSPEWPSLSGIQSYYNNKKIKKNNLQNNIIIHLLINKHNKDLA